MVDCTPVIADHPVNQGTAGLGIAEVGGVEMSLAARTLDLGSQLLELLDATSDTDGPRPGGRDTQRR